MSTFALFRDPRSPKLLKTITNMYVSRFRDFRSRAARTYALDNGILILFRPLLARDRPEIDFWHTFKAKKVTHFQLLHFSEIPAPPNSWKTTTNMCVSRFRDFRSRAPNLCSRQLNIYTFLTCPCTASAENPFGL